MTTEMLLSLASSESTHTNRPLNRNLLFHFKNAGDHPPISSFTIMWRFHLKCHEPIWDPHQHSRALAAYKDFLTLWKDADPDIPILKEAKADYAKLQQPSRLGESLPF